MSKFKQFIKEKWAWIVAGFVLIGGVIAAILAFSRPSTNDGESLPSPVQKAKEKLHQDLTKARIDAAVEIATSRGEEKVVKEEIKQIVETTKNDASQEAKKKQLEQLAALASRTRRR